MPFYAISFAFLGLSSAGIVTYLKFKKSPVRPLSYLAVLLNMFCLSLLFYSVYGLKLLRFLGYRNLNFLYSGSQPSGFSQVLDLILVDIIINSLYYGFCISVCFFFLGILVSYLYKYYAEHSSRLYLFDLIGAAAGCFSANFIIEAIPFNSIPIFLSLLAAILAYGIAIKSTEARYSKHCALFCIAMSVFIGYLNLTTGFLEIKRAPNLAVLDYQLKDDVRELWYDWNSYSRLSLLSNRVQGESTVNYLFTIDNGRGNAHLQAFDPEDPYRLPLFDEFKAVSLAYLTETPKDLLIMFAGAGIDMLQAHSYSKGKSNITGVELNPLIVNSALKLPQFHLKEFFAKDNIHMHIQEARNFLNSTDELYDSIIYSWGGASFSNYLGISGYTGRYLYTKEAMRSLILHLKPNGTIGIVNANKLRLAAIIKAAFEELGYKNFEEHLLVFQRTANTSREIFDTGVYSSLNDHVLLFKKSPFTSAELERALLNAQRMRLKLIYSPVYTHPDFGVYEQMVRSDDIDRFMKELGRRELLDLSISTDNKPFIDNIFYPQIILTKEFWTNLDKLSRRDSTKQNTLNLYTFWFIILLTLTAFIFIMLPLILTQKISVLKDALPYLYYFSVLGVGFILIEITVMNQFVLFLGNPIYSFSLILASLLLSSGIGSYFSQDLFERKMLSLKKMALVCSAFLVGYFFVLPVILQNWLGISFPFKVIVTFLVILPLGMCLGMMFPQGLKKLSGYNKDLVPWAWGLNGYMSTIGSAVSIYLSMMIGFSWFILIAAVLYFSLIFIFPKE